jgi:hypothetical protein
MQGARACGLHGVLPQNCACAQVSSKYYSAEFRSDALICVTGWAHFADRRERQLCQFVV